LWGLAIVDPPLENAECGRCPRKAEIRPLGEPEVARIKQKATPQSATPKKTERTEKKREKRKGKRDGKEKTETKQPWALDQVKGYCGGGRSKRPRYDESYLTGPLCGQAIKLPEVGLESRGV